MPKSETVQNGNKIFSIFRHAGPACATPKGCLWQNFGRQALISKGDRRYRARQLADLLTLSRMGDSDPSADVQNNSLFGQPHSG